MIVHGAAMNEDAAEAEARRALVLLLEELPLKQAAALAARLTGVAKNRLYEYGLKIKNL